MFIVIAEAEELEFGGYEVIGVANSLPDAREMAREDLARRLKLLDESLEPGGAGIDVGLCPNVYKIYDPRISRSCPVAEVEA